MLDAHLGKIVMKNPLILASGIRGSSKHLLIRSGKEGAGAATSKSCSLAPKEGHPNPTMICEEGIMFNAIGLSNPGIDEEIDEIREAVLKAEIPIIASIFGKSVEEFAEAAKRISKAGPAMIEVNISCPNINRESRMFSANKDDAAAVASAVKSSTKIPFSMKLTPDVPNIGEIASACVDCGADCITAVNTIGGMFIDARAKRALLGNKFGGISGSLIKPVALKAVYNVRKAIGPKVPIIGTGGVQTGLDAVEMIMAGANAVGIGTAVVQRKDAFREICKEMKEFMKKEGYSNLSQLKLDESV